MTEEYLQFIWQLKRIPKNELFLQDGRKVTILNFGWLNSDPGPDFFNGQVEIDGIKWVGNIEIHVKSSEWFLHKHQHDSAYNNVILHVVFDNDKQVYLDKSPIPTLELKDLINEKHYNQYKSIAESKGWIPCVNHIPLDDLAVYQQMSASLYDRFHRKSRELVLVFNNSNKDLKQVLHYSIFSSFGGRVNKEAFIQLSNLLPYSIIEKESWEKERLESLIFGVAGLLECDAYSPYFLNLKQNWLFLKRKHNLSSMSSSTWKFGGVRPSSFPTIKLAQLSSFLFYWKYQTNWEATQAADYLSFFKHYLSNDINPFWSTHYTFKKIAKRKHKVCLSESAKSSIIINGLVPYLWFLGEHKKQNDFIQYALEVLELLPAELNSQISKWNKVGVHAKNSADSQSLLELKNQFCTFRKCLQCKIGCKILSNSK